MINIAVDLMGADKTPEELVSGVAAAINTLPDINVLLYGDKARYTAALDGAKFDRSRLEITHTSCVIENSDDPVEAFTAKKDSSLVAAMTACKTGAARGFVSCGATGAIFVSALMSLKKIADTPVLAVEPKHADGTPFCIVDCGANVECRAEKLVGFARTGVAYMKAIGVAQPRVALLNNGREDKKGNALTKKANELLRVSGLNFIGNIEGTEILENRADVVVCDGFSGNILLKTIEGVAKGVLSQVRAVAPKADLSALENEYDYTVRGGAMLLGFETPIVKGHGAASAETVNNIITAAYDLAKNKLSDKLREEYGG